MASEPLVMALAPAPPRGQPFRLRVHRLPPRGEMLPQKPQGPQGFLVKRRRSLTAVPSPVVQLAVVLVDLDARLRPTVADHQEVQISRLLRH
eukprot:5267338-Pyramimonas_sp.AAC.1